VPFGIKSPIVAVERALSERATAEGT